MVSKVCGCCPPNKKNVAARIVESTNYRVRSQLKLHHRQLHLNLRRASRETATAFTTYDNLVKQTRFQFGGRPAESFWQGTVPLQTVRLAHLVLVCLRLKATATLIDCLLGSAYARCSPSFVHMPHLAALFRVQLRPAIGNLSHIFGFHVSVVNLAKLLLPAVRCWPCPRGTGFGAFSNFRSHFFVKLY